MPQRLPPEHERAIQDFVRASYGLAGTWALHREALGWDLVRAPLNVLLAGLAFVVRMLGWGAGRIGWHGAQRRLARVRLVLPTRIARAEAERLRTGLLAPLGLPQDRETVRRYIDVRVAIGEITAILAAIFVGLSYQTVTPGFVSLSPVLARSAAHARAVAEFPLGMRAGEWWYGVFPVEAGLSTLLLIGAGLLIGFALLATLAGLVTDPLQRITGLHRWRVRRLVRTLMAVRDQKAASLTMPEQTLARTGDVADLLLNLKRLLFGS